MLGDLKFKYFKFPLQNHFSFFGPSILKPIIPIQIKVGVRNLRYAALIDSGADFCIFDAGIGERLGLNIREGQALTFGGIQDRAGAVAFIHKVTLVVGGRDHNVEVGFSYDIAQHGFAVLGQRGFFEIFVVKFDLVKEEVELKLRK